jgi:hypothetical protein
MKHPLTVAAQFITCPHMTDPSKGVYTMLETLVEQRKYSLGIVHIKSIATEEHKADWPDEYKKYIDEMPPEKEKP